MNPFILNYVIAPDADANNTKVRQRCGTRASAIGIGLNLFLALGKCLLGFFLGSIAVLADGINNLSDAGASIVTLVGFRLAGREPDPEHPFGHGRMEYLAGLLVALAIIFMGIEIGQTSFKRIFTPQWVDFSWLTVSVLLLSIVIKLWMYFFYRRIGIRIDSAAMTATAADSLSDSVSTAVVLCAILIQELFSVQIDAFAGLLVAAFILRAGWDATMDAIDPILGRPMSPELAKDIDHIALSYHGIVGIHDLIYHDYGPGRVMMSFHAEVPADGNLLELHDVIDDIERELKAKHGIDAVIHMDPVVFDERTCQMRERVEQLVKTMLNGCTIHDFRITAGPLHTNIIFDVVVPYKFSLTDNTIRETLCTEICSWSKDYFCVLEIDHSYVQ